MPDSSLGHSSMLANVKKLFKKGPSSPSSKDKPPSSPSGTDTANGGRTSPKGNSDSRSHGREMSGSSGHSSSRGKRSSGQAGAHQSSQGTTTSNGYSSINQLFPVSPRANGLDSYFSAQSASPRPSSDAPFKPVRSSTKPGTDPMQKVAEMLGVSVDELVDYTRVERDGNCSHDCESVSDSEDDQSFTETPVCGKSEIPSSFEFQPPPIKVVQDGGNLSEARISPRSASESQLEERNKSGGKVVPKTYELSPMSNQKSKTLSTACSLPEPVNGHLTSSHVSNNHLSPGRQSWMPERVYGRPSCEVNVTDSRLSPPRGEEGYTEVNGFNYSPFTHYTPRSDPRRSVARESGSPYRTGEEQAADLHCYHSRISKKSSVQSQSPRSNPTLSSGFQSPRSQFSPRSTVGAPNGSHSPEGRSCSSTASSVRGRQDWSDSNGSASPQWGHNGDPSPDWGTRSDRSSVQGHPLPVPPSLSSPQHYLYGPGIRIYSPQEFSPKGIPRERPASGLGYRGTSPSSQYVSVVSPIPSPPRSPLQSSPRPLAVPYSPRSPLPVHPVSRYPSPPKSPSRAPKVPTKWKKIRQIGIGSFGTVHEAMNLDDGSFFAVKISHGETITPEIQKEIEVLSYLKHPNVVQYYGTGQEDGHLCIFLELMQNSLQSIITHFQFFDEALISTYTRQILQGLEYLHKKNTIHRDIKCANILVDKDGQVKLADFGLAKEVGLDPVTSCKGTPYFMAPEILKPDRSGTRGYGLPVDIWSLGCTVIEMADGKPPWSGTRGFSWFFQILNKELPPLPPHLSPACVDFIRSCLRFKPEDRPSASELLRHRFVANAPATVVSPTTVASPLTTLAGHTPPPPPFFRSGHYSDQAQSGCSGGPPATVERLPSPPSPEHQPRVQRCDRLQRTLSRSYSNPCIDTRDFQEAIYAPRTPPPATSDYGRNYGFTGESWLQP